METTPAPYHDNADLDQPDRHTGHLQMIWDGAVDHNHKLRLGSCMLALLAHNRRRNVNRAVAYERRYGRL